MAEEKMIPILIKVPEGMVVNLKKMTTADDTSRSKLIRDLIRKEWKRYNRKQLEAQSSNKITA